MPSFIAGLSLVRGMPLPVVDGAVLVGQAGPAIARFVTLQIGERQAVLGVQEVIGMHAMAAAPFHVLPPLLGGARGEVVSAIGVLDAEFLWLLDAARIVPDEVWRAALLEEATT